MAKIIPISEHFQHFLAEMKDEREFLGRFIRADEASLAAVFRAAVGAATRSLFGLGAVRTAAWPTASLSQRLRVWRRRFRRCIRGHDISVVGCIRCATSWRKCGSQT